jgi:hypothetical protein
MSLVTTEPPATAARRGERSRGMALVIGMVALMWLVEAVDVVAGDLDSAGIRPRDATGSPASSSRPSCTAASGTCSATPSRSWSWASRSRSAG